MAVKILLLATAMLTALISGFFYAYVCSVNPGLRRLSTVEYLRAMESVNQAVLNPVFFASFFGALVLIPLSTLMLYFQNGVGAVFYLFMAASVTYFIGVFLVTGIGNVPLNESLAKVDLSMALPEEIKQYRSAFESL